MADSAEGSNTDPQVAFKVKTSGDKSHTITMSESATVLDLKTKLAGSDYENIPIERQRLIYSGRVMKNDEPLSTYKIKAGNTIHLVKSAASNQPQAQGASSSTSAAPQVPTNMAAGTANNPLAGLTGARYAGLTNLPSADMFGPDGGMSGSMGVSDADMESMLNNPNFLQQMNEMMNNDAFIHMMESHPAFRNNPSAAQMLRDPEFRRMMLNPETIRHASRMQRMMRGQGGVGAFPMPGATDNTPSGDASATGGNNAGTNNANAGAGGQFNPFDPALFGGMPLPGAAGGDGGNPFAAFLNPFMIPGQGGQGVGAGVGAGAGAQAGANATAGDANAGQGQGASNTTAGNSTSNPSSAPPNPFASLFGGFPGAGAGAGAGAGTNPFGTLPPLNPEGLQQMMQLLGVNSQTGSPAPPVDNRPPEERYADQLRQLNDMGFTDFDRNVAALRRSGGSVQGAIEHLLS
ncbi:hypothetical protein DL767_004408 [Monosporascus sp. MG133]|nr:hypothetical protein DL767_004408 [Monosporascus sp. MG133]